jgi:2'-5' RNA ligase
LVRTHGLTGAPVKPENLHVTLFPLGEYCGSPDGLIPAVSSIAQSICAAPFDASFNMAMSFHLRLVLCGTDGVVPIAALQRQFGQKFGHIIKGGTQKTPHITLLYADKAIEKQPVEPVRWKVDEFVLIHSLIGKATHQIAGRWPLRGTGAIDSAR